MKPSTILRTLSSLRFLSPSPAVTPLPISTPFDQQVTEELDCLLSSSPCVVDKTGWLCQALNASIVTQKIALQSISRVSSANLDPQIIENYLNNNTEMLDGCNRLLEKVESIQEYVNLLKIVTHLLEKKYLGPTTVARAREALDTCQAIERRSSSAESGLRKKSSRNKLANVNGSPTNLEGLDEILDGSIEVAQTVRGILRQALSFRPTSSKLQHSRRTRLLSSSWSCSLQELQERGRSMESEKNGDGGLSLMIETVNLVRELKDRVLQSADYQNGVLDKLRKNSGTLEEGMVLLEGKVKELYKQLVSVRMALMNISSQA